MRGSLAGHACACSDAYRVRARMVRWVPHTPWATLDQTRIELFRHKLLEKRDETDPGNSARAIHFPAPGDPTWARRPYCCVPGKRLLREADLSTSSLFAPVRPTSAAPKRSC